MHRTGEGEWGCGDCGARSDQVESSRFLTVEEARAAAPGGLEEYTGSFRGDAVADRSWLMEDSGGGVEVDPGLLAKMAGRDYSPREQREFIDESGEARNLAKLDLEGTHYVVDLGDDPELALW
jgi:hypothetical protein